MSMSSHPISERGEKILKGLPILGLVIYFDRDKTCKAWLPWGPGKENRLSYVTSYIQPISVHPSLDFGKLKLRRQERVYVESLLSAKKGKKDPVHFNKS